MDLPSYDQLIHTIGMHSNLGPETNYVVWNINKGKGQGFSPELLEFNGGNQG